MSLPASNRKAPSRAAIAATLSALAIFGASSALANDATQGAAQGYGQPAFGYGFQGQFPPASYGYAPQAPYGAPGGYAVQPASTYSAPAPQGYAAPAPVAPPAPAYGAPQQFPGYGIPGGYPAPGFDPYAGNVGFGYSSQWGQFAPSEPNYAPAERDAASAPAEAAPEVAPAKAATVSSDYSYEVVPAPASSATYVGNSQQITSTGNDPYQSAPVQQAPAAETSYQVVAPNYTQQYDAVAAFPAPAPQAPAKADGYEYQGATQQPAADYYDLSAQTAAPAAVVVTPAPAPAYEVTAYAPAPQQTAPVGGHFVQVGAFLDPARANNLVNKLGSAGEQAFIVSAQVRGKLYHRVRVVAASKRDARVARDRIRGLGYYEARMVKG